MINEGSSGEMTKGLSGHMTKELTQCVWRGRRKMVPVKGVFENAHTIIDSDETINVTDILTRTSKKAM